MVDQLRTIREASERLRVSEGTLYALLRQGAIRSVQIGVGKRRPRRFIPDSELDRFLTEQLQGDPRDAA